MKWDELCVRTIVSPGPRSIFRVLDLFVAYHEEFVRQGNTRGGNGTLGDKGAGSRDGAGALEKSSTKHEDIWG